jgi:hypothetical protein
MPGCGTQLILHSQTAGGKTCLRNGHKITFGAASLAKRIMSSADTGVRTCKSTGRMTSCPFSRNAAHSACGTLANLV